MSRYDKGRRLEYRTMRLLEGLGYSCYRTAGSHGEWDVIAIGPNDVKLVQSKANRRPGSVEIEGLRLFRCPANMSREVWIWKDRKKFPVVEVL